jgi:hypothetical protein
MSSFAVSNSQTYTTDLALNNTPIKFALDPLKGGPRKVILKWRKGQRLPVVKSNLGEYFHLLGYLMVAKDSVAFNTELGTHAFSLKLEVTKKGFVTSGSNDTSPNKAYISPVHMDMNILRASTPTSLPVETPFQLEAMVPLSGVISTLSHEVEVNAGAYAEAPVDQFPKLLKGVPYLLSHPIIRYSAKPLPYMIWLGAPTVQFHSTWVKLQQNNPEPLKNSFILPTGAKLFPLVQLSSPQGMAFHPSLLTCPAPTDTASAPLKGGARKAGPTRTVSSVAGKSAGSPGHNQATLASTSSSRARASRIPRPVPR